VDSCPILERVVDVTYVADNVKVVESLKAFEKSLFFMSINPRKCDCGSIFVDYVR